MRPSSIKNRSGERDPEMHQTRKDQQWYFGLKAHIGVDSKEGHVYSPVHLGGLGGRKAHVAGPAARGRAQGVGDGGCQGQGEAIRQAAPDDQDMTDRRVQYKNFVDELFRKGEESDQGESKSQNGASLSYTEAHLWIREGEILGNQEKAASTLYLLCPGQPVCASETV